MAKRGLLNVKSQLERLIRFREAVDKYAPNALPPALRTELASMCLIAAATLRKTNAAGRKDAR